MRDVVTKQRRLSLAGCSPRIIPVPLYQSLCMSRMYPLWKLSCQSYFGSTRNLKPYNYPLGHLTHWGRVAHICVSKLTIIGSDNGLMPCRRQTIIWNNAGILLIRTSGTNFSEIVSQIHAFSFKKMHLKMSSAKWRSFCLGLNVLNSGKRTLHQVLWNADNCGHICQYKALFGSCQMMCDL